MDFTEKVKPVERSWQGGPLRQCHIPKLDSRWLYVCDRCKRPARTGVRLNPSAGEWQCASCERGETRKTVQLAS